MAVESVCEVSAAPVCERGLLSDSKVYGVFLNSLQPLDEILEVSKFVNACLCLTLYHASTLSYKPMLY